MAEREQIVWNGVKFYRYPDAVSPGARTYFTAAPVRLHRAVWEFHNGPVPHGHHIHHVDGDTANNDIANLECVPAGQHESDHWSPERRERARARMRDIVRPAADAWHRSPDGIAWHREHGRRVFSQREPQPYVCEQCAAEFATTKLGHVRFCSNACRSAWRRAAGLDDVDRVCGWCGAGYRANKHSKSKACSIACGRKLAWAKRRGVQPDGPRSG